MEEVAREPAEVRRVGTSGVIKDFTGRTRTVTPPGAALEVVLEGAPLAERDVRMEIMAETGVHEVVKVIIPPPPYQYGQRHQIGDQSNREGYRST